MLLKFIHLKVHSEFSLMDSLLTIDSILDACIEKNIVALGLTDISNFFGAIKFYNKSLQKGIKPIFGIDIYIEVQNKIYPLTLIAKNNNGYKILVELISYGYVYQKRINSLPIYSKKILKKFNYNDIFILNGGINGELGNILISKDSEDIQLLINEYFTIFPKKNFFIELHRIGVFNEELYIQEAIKLAAREKIPVIATNNVCFLSEEDFYYHEIRVGITNGYTMLNKNRISKYTSKQYFRSHEEMCKLFSDIPESLLNTIYIAENANVTFTLGKYILPTFPVTNLMTQEDYFKKLSWDGLAKKILSNHHKADNNIETVYKNRLTIEIELICKMKFSGYFLIVADFIKWAKKNNIPVGPGRGSGAGSLVAYVLNITDIDPITYGLLFERFLNNERLYMPDLDIDFCMENRDRVIEYVNNKYKKDNVAQIITYSSMTAKSVVRDVGRVLGYPYALVDRLAKLIPNSIGIKLKDIFYVNSPLYLLCKQNKDFNEIIIIAKKLENLVKGVSKHAAGLVIAPKKIVNYSPIYCEEGKQQLITQFNKEDIEKIGLIKFDFLGLKTLTIINNTLNMINNNKEKIDIQKLPLNNSRTFTLLQKGETTGVFQLESIGIKALMIKMKPKRFEDIIALIALYRPGPLSSGMVNDFINRKNKTCTITYPNLLLKNILNETYGIILYQEQIMQIVHKLANYSLGEADILRRAISKNDKVEMEHQRQRFFLKTKQHDSNESHLIFNLIKQFAKYGFNKSHSTAYALISYQTAYLKANYPEEFMLSLLSSEIDNKEKLIDILYETKKMNIKIHLPNINFSDYYFILNNKNEILYGLGAIKGIGMSMIHMILNEREKNGLYKNLYDFCLRINTKKITKKICEKLIFSGSMDIFDNNRICLLNSLDNIIKLSDQQKKIKLSNQLNLINFEKQNLYIKNSASLYHEDKNILINERSLLGLFLSKHMIDQDVFWINHLKNLKSLNQLKRLENNTITFIYSTYMSLKILKNKLGKTIYLLNVEDNLNRQTIILLHELYQQTHKYLIPNNNYIIETKIIRKRLYESLQLMALNIYSIKDYVNKYIKQIKIICSLKKLPIIYDILSSLQNDNASYIKSIKIIISSHEYECHSINTLKINCYSLKNKICILEKNNIKCHFIL